MFSKSPKNNQKITKEMQMKTYTFKRAFMYIVELIINCLDS